MTPAELEHRWSALPAGPVGRGTVAAIAVRPAVDARAYPPQLELDPVRGVLGDRWERRTWMYLADGRPDPRVQVAVANAALIRMLQALAGTEHHPGDTLLVDLALDAASLPVGAHLRAGTAVLEVSDVENDGCEKFGRHYGAAALAWVRLPGNRSRRLRGLFARIVTGGIIRVGDPITREPAA